MSRTTILKIGYVLVVGGLIAAGLYLLFANIVSTGAFAILLLLLFLTSRIPGLVYRDLFRGRRLLAVGQPEQSLVCTSRFLEQIRKNPGQKRWMWLCWAFYTRDVEAMALNNLGAARLELGAREEAGAAFQDALVIDPEYPIPYFNLAVLAELQGDRAIAERYVHDAAARGFSNSTIDRVIAMTCRLYARLEGRGTGESAASS